MFDEEKGRACLEWKIRPTPGIGKRENIKKKNCLQLGKKDPITIQL